MNLPSNLKITKKNLTGFYLAGVFSFFFFQLEIIASLVLSIADWFYSVIVSIFATQFQKSPSNALFWFCFLLIAVFVTMLVKISVTDPLGMYSEEESTPTWELIILFLLVFGAYIYLLNNSFSQPMPTSVFQTQLIRLLDGAKNTGAIPISSVEETKTWQFVHWLWNIGPITFMYVRMRMNTAEN